METLTVWQHLRLQTLCDALAQPAAAVADSGERHLPYGSAAFAFADKSYENLRDALKEACGWGYLCRCQAGDEPRGLYLEVSRSGADGKLEFVPADAMADAANASRRALPTAVDVAVPACEAALAYLFEAAATTAGVRSGRIVAPVAPPPIDPRLPPMPPPAPELPSFTVKIVPFADVAGDDGVVVAQDFSTITVGATGAAPADGAAVAARLYRAAESAIAAAVARVLEVPLPAARPHTLAFLAAAIADARRTQRVGMAKAPLSLLEQAALADPAAESSVTFCALQQQVEFPELVPAPAAADGADAAGDDGDEEQPPAYYGPLTYSRHIDQVLAKLAPSSKSDA